MQIAVSGVFVVSAFLLLQIATFVQIQCQTETTCECSHITVEITTRDEIYAGLPNLSAVLADVCEFTMPLVQSNAAVALLGVGCVLLGGLASCIVLSYSGSLARQAHSAPLCHASPAGASGQRRDVLVRARALRVHQIPTGGWGTVSRAPALGEGLWDDGRNARLISTSTSRTSMIQHWISLGLQSAPTVAFLGPWQAWVSTGSET